MSVAISYYQPQMVIGCAGYSLAARQVWDNIFFSCVSGVTVWTMYEAGFLWLRAGNELSWLPLPAGWVYESIADSPLYSFAWLLLIPIWREFHFYW